MNNRTIWDKLKTPPANALKKIEAGRLKGKSDINPQWRYEVMTEVFGPCGVGWKFTVDRVWSEPASDGQVFAFAAVSIYIRYNDEWSNAIPGYGGSMLLEMERNGIHSSDEGYKMAITDAIGTAMKMIGVAAEVYRGNYDGSKYAKPDTPSPAPKPQASPAPEGKDAEYMERTKSALRRLFGDDKVSAFDTVEKLTAFKDVPGVRDFRKLTGKRLEILCHNLEKMPEGERQPGEEG